MNDSNYAMRQDTKLFSEENPFYKSDTFIVLVGSKYVTIESYRVRSQIPLKEFYKQHVERWLLKRRKNYNLSWS